MKRTRGGTQASRKGPAEFFTGTVRIEPLRAPTLRASVSRASVTFEPAARTARRTQPLGQTLVVTAGCNKAYRPRIVQNPAGLYKKPGHNDVTATI